MTDNDLLSVNQIFGELWIGRFALLVLALHGAARRTMVQHARQQDCPSLGGRTRT